MSLTAVFLTTHGQDGLGFATVTTNPKRLCCLTPQKLLSYSGCYRSNVDFHGALLIVPVRDPGQLKPTLTTCLHNHCNPGQGYGDSQAASEPLARNE